MRTHNTLGRNTNHWRFYCNRSRRAFIHSKNSGFNFVCKCLFSFSTRLATCWSRMRKGELCMCISSSPQSWLNVECVESPSISDSIQFYLLTLAIDFSHRLHSLLWALPIKWIFKKKKCRTIILKQATTDLLMITIMNLYTLRFQVHNVTALRISSESKIPRWNSERCTFVNETYCLQKCRLWFLLHAKQKCLKIEIYPIASTL